MTPNKTNDDEKAFEAYDWQAQLRAAFYNSLLAFKTNGKRFTQKDCDEETNRLHEVGKKIWLAALEYARSQPDLSQMMDECDKLANAKYQGKTDLCVEDSGISFSACVRGDVNYCAYGKTRREAVKNLLEKLKEAKV